MILMANKFRSYNLVLLEPEGKTVVGDYESLVY